MWLLSNLLCFYCHVVRFRRRLNFITTVHVFLDVSGIRRGVSSFCPSQKQSCRGTNLHKPWGHISQTKNSAPGWCHAATYCDIIQWCHHHLPFIPFAICQLPFGQAFWIDCTNNYLGAELNKKAHCFSFIISLNGVVWPLFLSTFLKSKQCKTM